MRIKYNKLVTTSWNLMVNNKILFVPKIFMFLFAFILFIGYLAASGIMNLLIKNPAMVYDQLVLHEQIRSYISRNPIWALVSLIIYILVVILSDLFFITMKYGMITDVIKKKKTSLHSGYLFAKKYYGTSLVIHLISYVLVLGPLALVGVVFYNIATKTNSFILMTPWIIVAIFLLLVFLYIAYMLMRLVFIYPVMAFEEEGAFSTVKKDFHYVKKHIGHTLITWMLFVVIWFGFTIAKTPLGSIENKAENLFIIISLAIVILILESLVSVWEHLFIFKAYVEGKDVKKEKVFKEDDSWKQIY